MSVHPHGDKWRVVWRRANGKQTSRVFDRKGDADRHDTDIRRRKQLGPRHIAELEVEKMTLREYVTGPWRMHAATLSQASRNKYRWALERHLLELLDEPIIGIDASRVLVHQTYLTKHKRTPNTAREALLYLGGILQLAVTQGRIPANPVRAVRKTGGSRPPVRPLAVEQLERLITEFDGRDRALVLLGGHLGLRPGEARQITWEQWHDGRLVVPAEIVKANARRTRSVDVPRATAAELRAWRLQSGGRDGPTVGAMTANAVRLWNRKRLRPATKRLFARDDVTLKTLRHTHASMLHYAGYTLPEAAARMGHSTAVHVATYAHVIEGLGGHRFDNLDELIAHARRATLLQHQQTL